MTVDQQTFDTDLAALVTAIGNLTTAVDEWIATHPDLTAEDQQVQQAAQQVADELAKITPPPASAESPQTGAGGSSDTTPNVTPEGVQGSPTPEEAQATADQHANAAPPAFTNTGE